MNRGTEKREKQNRKKNRKSDSIEVINLDSQKERTVQKTNPSVEHQSTEKNRHRSGQETAKLRAGQNTATRKSGRNREFLIITYLFLFLFIAMAAYLVYFQVVKSDSFISSSNNPRLDMYSEHVIRGDILSSDGEVLAQTEVADDGTETRYYPYGNVFAHVVGYTNNGKGGLEAQYNFNLLRSHSFILSTIINDITGTKSQGDEIVTTLDTGIQQIAYNALGSRDGAVVVLEVSTGKVLAMVSKPDFDPNTLSQNWDSIVEDDESSVLLNRCVSGLYPPGSVFKIFTTLEYIHENPDTYQNYSFDCEGELDVDGNEIHCYHSKVHGEENLEDSFANSCNTSFSTIGLTLNISKFQSLCDSMLFNTALPGDIAANNSQFTLSTDASVGKIMQTSIGQGDTLVTPIHMAFVAATIANGGVAMEPYLVEKIENANQVTVKEYKPKEYDRLISSSDNAILQQFMEAVVDHGTASALSGQSYSAAGKTGSAEYNSEGDSHGWFVGYASKDGYSDIAIAVVVEDGGSGSQSAVPVAKQIFDYYFNR